MTARGQKRKRGGSVGGQRVEGPGRARSKYTGVYQQSRGNGWFASICVDKSVRFSQDPLGKALSSLLFVIRGIEGRGEPGQTFHLHTCGTLIARGVNSCRHPTVVLA